MKTIKITINNLYGDVVIIRVPLPCLLQYEYNANKRAFDNTMESAVNSLYELKAENTKNLIQELNIFRIKNEALMQALTSNVEATVEVEE